jgi:hypothetical protein
MARFGVVDREGKYIDPVQEQSALNSDQRWQLATRVVASRHFARSPLLSKFLLYIVAEAIGGRSEEITEHQIGVRVFERPAGYRTIEDNIVRSYARQLRRRLSDYFSREGSTEPVHIDIPLGGYVPVFTGSVEGESRSALPAAPAVIDEPHAEVMVPAAPEHEASGGRRFRRVVWLLWFAFYSAAIVLVAWYAGAHSKPGAGKVLPTASLWNSLFGGPLTTYIVPADAGLNLIEDITHKPLQLAEYINGDYLKSALPQVDNHSAEDLRTQNFTSFVDLQIISTLTRLPQFNPQRAVLRFPRDLRLDDLKNANAVILGSVGSNPWAAIAEGRANFRIIYDDRMGGATIANAHPMSGENALYVSHWNEPAHETFALISYLPSLGGDGHLLIVQGLDVAGTQAAGEALFHPELIAPVLKQATRPDGTVRNFEILLRASSIESSATGTAIIGSRIY